MINYLRRVEILALIIVGLLTVNPLCSQVTSTVSTTYTITPAIGTPKVLFWQPYSTGNATLDGIRSKAYLYDFPDYTGDLVSRSGAVKAVGTGCYSPVPLNGLNYGVGLETTDYPSVNGCSNGLQIVAGRDHALRFTVADGFVGNPRFFVDYSSCIPFTIFNGGGTFGDFGTCGAFALPWGFLPINFGLTNTSYWSCCAGADPNINLSCLTSIIGSGGGACGCVYASCLQTGYGQDTYLDFGYSYSVCSYTNNATSTGCTFQNTYDCGNPYGPCSSYSCGSTPYTYSRTYVCETVTTATFTATNYYTYCISESTWFQGTPSLCSNCSSPRNVLRYDITVYIADNRDLAVTKSSDKTNYLAGETITFTINAKNNGTTAIAPATVSDVLPAGLTLIGWETTMGSYNTSTGLWSIPTLGGGQTAILVIKAKATTAGSKTNTAFSTINDSNKTNDTARVTITTQPSSTVTTKPPFPCDFVVKGPSNVCASATNQSVEVNYTTLGLTPPPGQVITWSVPAGYTIVSGQGTGNLIVNVGQYSGYISVTVYTPASANYGESTCEKYFLINVNSTPNPDGINK